MTCGAVRERWTAGRAVPIAGRPARPPTRSTDGRPDLWLYRRHRGAELRPPLADVRADDHRAVRRAHSRDRAALPDPDRAAPPQVLRGRGAAAARPVR